MTFRGSKMTDLEKRYQRAAKAGLAGANPVPPSPKPDIPDELGYLLLWYSEMRNAMSRGWRFEPLSHSEILAYKTLHDLDMTSWDVGIIRQLDGVWQSVQPEPENSSSANGRDRVG